MTIYNESQLSNGIRVVTEKIPYVKSASFGIWVGAGSRYEEKTNSGISHFIEHLLFKGTERRSAKEIAEELDTVGGQLNAFTSKEYTCYYARVLDEHLDIALDVLSDMFFNSKFKQEDIDKERQVVIEEINMYEDTPDEIIHDIFSERAWPNHPLGRAILGTEESLTSITREDIQDYMNKTYTADNIVLALAGNFDHSKVLEQLELLFGVLKNKKSQIKITIPDYNPNISNVYKDISQVNICLGTPGLAQADPRLYGLSILNNVLGGSLSSRLVQEIREERGLAYSVFSYHSAFKDTGLFNFYAGTRPSNYEKIISLILAEGQKIAKGGISEQELYKAKEQLKGNLYLGLESVSSRMTRMGRALLCLDKILTPEETIAKVEKVTNEDVRELAANLLAPDNFSITTIGPIKDVADRDFYFK